MAGRLADRVAVVTGGSRGIGAAIAEAFAREGARVAIASRKLEGLTATADRINASYPGAVLPVACHVGRVDEIDRLLERVRSELGVADVLVNNAGTNPYFGPLMGVTPEAWDKTFEVNLKGPFELTRRFATALFDAGRPGSILFTSSIVGARGAPMQGVYAMTKASLISLTQTLALELGAAGIRVNAIAPGLVDTRLASVLVNDPTLKAMVLDRAAIKRPAVPEEIAGVAVFLASDESRYMTGQTVYVDGGYTAG